MSNVNQFFKISPEQYEIDNMASFGCESYDDIKLPKRATKYSAGHDFYAPMDITIEPGLSVKIPTGIRVKLNPTSVLLCFPRSSLGMKYKLKLDNTVGVIDADYFNSDNEGHIWVSMTNMSDDKVCTIKKGEAMFQGVIVGYEKTVNDEVTTVRNGGMGSTNNSNNNN